MANARGRTDHRRRPAAAGAVCLACLVLLSGVCGSSPHVPHPHGDGPRGPLSLAAGAGPAHRMGDIPADERRGTASPRLRTVHLTAVPRAFLVDDPARRVVVLQSTGQGRGDPGGNLVLTLLDARTGVPLRTVATRLPYPSDASGNVVVEMAVDPRSGRLLMAVSDTPGAPGRLDILDPRTLAVVATRRFHLATAGGGMLTDARLGRLFIRDFRAVGKGIADVVDVIDLRTGALLRTVRLSARDHVGDFVLDARAGRLFVGGRVLDAGSLAVVATIPPGNAGGYAVDEAAGRVVSVSDLGTVNGQPMTRVSILDARSGAVLHTLDGYCGAEIALDTAAGRVACLDSSRNGETAADVYYEVLDTRSGRLLHQYHIGLLVGATFTLGVDERHGRAIVVLAVNNGPGYADGITVVDLRSGRGTDSPVDLGQGPPDIVVDQTTGRTFVANEGDKTVSVLDTARLP